MTVKKPPPPPRKPATKKPAPPPARKVSAKPKKTFSIKSWTNSKKGEKIIIYADSGMGKTTLSSMAPNPIFIPLDDGSSKIKHPITGEHLSYVDDVETFDDYRAVLQDLSLFSGESTIITDTGTELEPLALTWMLENVPHEKGGPVKNIEGYGYGKGYRHFYDTMRLPLGDLDRVVNDGNNVIVVCQMQQVTVSNPAGDDFLCDAPKLQQAHGHTPSVWGLYCEWADHIFKIGYESIHAKDGKAIAGNDRAIFVHPEIHFKAKSRTISPGTPMISFSSQNDDSLWRFLFPDKYAEVE
jgi:hypothetical protein